MAQLSHGTVVKARPSITSIPHFSDFCVWRTRNLGQNQSKTLAALRSDAVGEFNTRSLVWIFADNQAKGPAMYSVSKAQIWLRKLRRTKKTQNRKYARAASPKLVISQEENSASLPNPEKNASTASVASFDRDVTKLEETRKWLEAILASPNGRSGQTLPPYNESEGSLVIDNEGRTRQLSAGEEAEREDNLKAAVLSRMSGIPSKVEFQWSKAQPMGYVVEDSDTESEDQLAAPCEVDTSGEDVVCTTNVQTI